MIVITFKPRFWPMIQARTKINTIRRERKRPVKIGDALSLRGWTGRPYMSPQTVVLGDQVCRATWPVEVQDNAFRQFDLTFREPLDLAAFAINDGFASWLDLVNYFHSNGGLPFYGTLIRWGTEAL